MQGQVARQQARAAELGYYAQAGDKFNESFWIIVCLKYQHLQHKEEPTAETTGVRQ
jgi:hypothetical protein